MNNITREVKIRKQKNTQVKDINNYTIRILNDNIEEEIKKEIEQPELFLYKPNGYTGMTENIEYNTNIIESNDGTEQRIPLLQNPRNVLSYYYTLLEEELQDFNNFIFRNQTKEIIIPIWQDIAFLDEDIEINDIYYKADLNFKRFKKDHKVIFINPKDFNDYEIYTLENFNLEFKEVYKSEGFKRKWSKDTIILPILNVRIQNAIQKTLMGASDRIAAFSLSFQSLISEFDIVVETKSLYPVYKNLSLIDIQPNKTSALTQRLQRKVLEIDLGYGKKQVYDKSNQSFTAFNYNLTLVSKEKINQFKTFMNENKGRLKDFWFPTFENDFKIVDKDYKKSYNYIIVKDTKNYETYKDRDLHIKINFKDKSYKCFNITNIEKFEENEKLILDDILSKDFNEKDVDSINLLFKCRFNSDDFLFNYLSNDRIQITKTAYMQKF